jgi:hypothetical protein
VPYILGRNEGLAMILLNNGADPTLTSSDRIDASLAAASRNCIEILEKLKTIFGPNTYNWGRTCRQHFTIRYSDGIRHRSTFTKCNALHLAAFNGRALSLRLYFQDFSHVDISAMVHEDNGRPLHFAAIGGSI